MGEEVGGGRGNNNMPVAYIGGKILGKTTVPVQALGGSGRGDTT